MIHIKHRERNSIPQTRRDDDNNNHNNNKKKTYGNSVLNGPIDTIYNMCYTHRSESIIYKAQTTRSRWTRRWRFERTPTRWR